MPEQFLTAAEIAKRLHVTVPTVRQWAKDGRLIGGVRITGRSIRWPASSLDALTQPSVDDTLRRSLAEAVFAAFGKIVAEHAAAIERAVAARRAALESDRMIQDHPDAPPDQVMQWVLAGIRAAEAEVRAVASLGLPGCPDASFLNVRR